MTSKFDSLTALQMKLMEEFHGYVPTTSDFNVGYMEGPASKQCKVALVTDNDLDCMYKRHSKGGRGLGLIMLWCDGKLNDKKKRSRDEGDGGRREEREEEVDSIYKELLERHGSTGNYSISFVVTNDCIWIT